MPNTPLWIGQTKKLTVAFKDSGGAPAPVLDGSIAWVSSDPAIASATEDPIDELSCNVMGLTQGTATITATADADLTDTSPRLINATAVVDVLATPSATTGTITAAAPAGTAEAAQELADRVFNQPT